MFNSLKAFLERQEGAVTVDWVVLTAALVGLALAVMGAVGTETALLAGDVSTVINDQSATYE